MREIRQAPDQAAFDRREIPVTESGEALPAPWYRLARVEYPNPFYASPGSRLTPDSGEFPCVYVGASRDTAVAEVWGDRMAAQRDRWSAIYVISLAQAREWAFLEVADPPSDLRLCDLTDSHTRLAVGLDSGTLYAADLRTPRQWAERIALHPTRFDGIHYRSRHTDESCLVLWSRPSDVSPLCDRLVFGPAGEFAECEAAYRLAAKLGMRLSFSW